MIINGLQIAESIQNQLRHRIGELQPKNVAPHLVVIFVGNNPSSAAYIKQKQLQGESIGAKVTVLQYPDSIKTSELEEKIHLLNADPFVHGILVQHPLPKHVDTKRVETAVTPAKDVDGFHPDSPYTLPLPLAVEQILKTIYENHQAQAGGRNEGLPKAHNQASTYGKEFLTGPAGDITKFHSWLQTQSIVLLGKGETAGKPIKNYFDKLGIEMHIIDSKTHEPEKMIKQADIIISAVGKIGIIKAKDVKKDAILIGVGMQQGEGKKLHGDYDEIEIKDIAAWYTPTPKGVGPVNVSMLMDNLVTATERQVLL